MKKMMTYMAEGLFELYKNEDRKNVFTIFGMDNILDTNLQPYIIEGNCRA